MTLDLYALRERLGGSVTSGGREWRGPGPGHSRHDNSLVVTISDDGRPLVHSFAGDGFRECAVHLGLERLTPMDRQLIEERARQRRVELCREMEVAEESAAELWSQTVPLEGSQAETYLYSRGLILETSAIRFHPSAPRSKSVGPDSLAPHPAMAALALDLFGRPRAIHFTYLRNGKKAFGDRSRLIFGRPRGCAVRLSEVGPDGALAIGEGIESCASYAELRGIPTWAALNTSGVASFQAPPVVRALCVAADNDKPGLAAADELRRRCKTSPRRMPTEIDVPNLADWNDELVASMNGRAGELGEKAA